MPGIFHGVWQHRRLVAWLLRIHPSKVGFVGKSSLDSLDLHAADDPSAQPVDGWNETWQPDWIYFWYLHSSKKDAAVMVAMNAFQLVPI